MVDDIAIKVDNVSKTFILPHEKRNSIKSVFVNFYKKKKGYEKQQVLNDISFEIKKGEFFGIVGRNGSGKSTLLKLLAGIYTPDSGGIEVNGKLTPFIELGVGFNPELSGRDNVFLNGALLGFSRTEMAAMYDEIVAFAELERFMDQKLKNYSSGMQVRLAFSIAIRANTDILVLDEVLAVGDESFQRKCFQYFAELKRNKKTVILVTHDMDAVQRFCTKTIMIEKGEMIEDGNPAQVARRYREIFVHKENISKKSKNNYSNKSISAKVDYKNVGGKLLFDLMIRSKISIEDPVVTFVINRDNGEMVYRWVTDEKIKKTIILRGDEVLKFQLEIENIFPNGSFEANLGVKSRDRSVEYAIFNNIVEFEIINKGSYSGDIYWKPSENLIFNGDRVS